MKNVNQKIKKYIRFLLVILVIIFSNFQSGYSEWVKQDLINKLNLDLGTIQQFKINTKNELVVLNKDNEIITINFETGEISNRCKCEIDSAATFISMSSDGESVIAQKFNTKNIYEIETGKTVIVENNYLIFDNKCNLRNQKTDSINIFANNNNTRFLGIKARYLDYFLKQNLLIYNYTYSIKDLLSESQGTTNTYGIFRFFDISKNQMVHNRGDIFQSMSYNKINEKIYFIFNKSKLTFHSYNTYKEYVVEVAAYNLKSQLFEGKLYNFYSQSSDRYGNTQTIGKYLDVETILSHYQNDKEYFVINENNNITDRKLAIKDTNQLIRLFSLNYNYNQFKTDNNNLLHFTDGTNYYISRIKDSLDILESFKLLPNKQLINYEFLTDENNNNIICQTNDNYLYTFTSDNLKLIPESGFSSDKQILNIGSNVTFVSDAKMKGLKFEWEVEPNIIIKTNEPVLNYQYKTFGNYDIKLKITDNNSKDYYFSKENYITVLPNLKADFNYKEDKNYTGIFHFENRSLGDPKSQSWYVNDILISNEKDFSYKFHLYGEYIIKLLIRNDLKTSTTFRNIIFRKNQKEEIKDSADFKLYLFDTQDKLLSVNLVNGKYKFAFKTFLSRLVDNDNIYKPIFYVGFKEYSKNYDLIFENIYLFSENYIRLNEYRYSDIKFNFSEFINDSSYNFSYYFKYYQNYFHLKGNYTAGVLYNYQKEPFDRSHKVDDNNINTFTLEQPDSILMRNITITPKAINSNYLTFDKNIKNFETEFRENINYLLLKYKDSTFSLNQYKFFAKKISDVINLPKSFEFSKLSLKGDNLYILGNEPFVDIKRGVIYKFNISTKGLEKYESDTYSNFTKIKWINDKSFVAWGEQSGSKGFVFMRNNLEVIKTNIYLNITGQINNIFFEDKKLTMVYENQAGSNFNVFIGEDEFTDEFMEVLSNNEVSDEIIIYPNPTSNKIKIMQQGKLFYISIYNITGLEVYSQQDLNSETEIDLSNLPTGNYWLKINNLDKMYSLQVNR